MESIIEKLGKVSVTVEKDYHNSEKEYNKLTIVEEQGAFKTYISRKPVPVGIELTNREYWIPFSGIKESLIIDYEKFKKEINNNINPIVIAYLVEHPELIVNVQNKSINIPKLAEDVINWFTNLQSDIDNEANTARFNEQKNADAIYSEINRAKAIELSIQKTLENITKIGEASAASNVTYVDNLEIGSANLQDVIDNVGKKTLDGEKKLSELDKDINIIYNKNTTSFIKGIYIKLSGEEHIDENFACTDFLYIYDHNPIKLVNCQTGNEYLSVIAFYNKYKNYISGITKITDTQVGTTIITNEQIPNGTCYIRVSAGKKEVEEKTAYIEYKSNKWLEAVNNISFAVNYNDKGRDIMSNNGYIDLLGDFVASNSFLSTDYLLLPLKQDIVLTGCNSSNSYVSLIAFYDIHKNFISKISNITTSDDIPYTVHAEDIPNNALYIRITADRNHYNNGSVFVDYQIKTKEVEKLLNNTLENFKNLDYFFNVIQRNLYKDFELLNGEYSDLLPINNNLITNKGFGSIRYDISNLKGEIFITGGVRNNIYINLWCITDSTNNIILYGDTTNISIVDTVILDNEQNKYLYVSVCDENRNAVAIFYKPIYVGTYDSCLYSHATVTSTNKLVEAIYPNGDKIIFNKLYCNEIESKSLHDLENRLCSNKEKDLLDESIKQIGLLKDRLLVFSDDFDTFDNNVWNKDTYIPGADSSYNTGKYRYLPECVTVKDSCLIITSKPSLEDGYNWDCGNVSSKGKFHLRAGRIDIKAKADRAPGQNLSIWTYGSDYTWPDGLEFDLFETFKPNILRTSIHCFGKKSGKHNTYSLKEDNINLNDWHIYSVEWNCKYIIFYRDNKIIAKKEIEDLDTVMNFVQSPQIILFQSGFNANCSDFKNEKGDREYKFIIDWVKIYAENNIEELLHGDMKSIPNISGIKFNGENKNVEINVGKTYHIPYQLIPAYYPNYAFVFAESSNPNIKFIKQTLTIDTSNANIGDKSLITIKYENNGIYYSDSFNLTIV